MTQPELVPDPSELPALQLALDSMQLTPNENLLVLAAGPALSASADPSADLASAVSAGAPADSGGDAEHPTPLSSLVSKIERAQPVQLRALVILALQNTWLSEGIELPGGGLHVSE